MATCANPNPNPNPKVLNELNAWQSKIFTEYPRKGSFKVLESVMTAGVSIVFLKICRLTGSKIL